MRIAIDLNDVLRDYTKNFARVYKSGYNRRFNLDNVDLSSTNDVKILFPFKTPKAFETFVYDSYAFELFGGAPPAESGLEEKFREWEGRFLAEFDEPIEVGIVSTLEAGHSIQASNFFLSKFGCQTREIFYPVDSNEIWKRYDVVITANPILLALKPEGKISVKIDREYNGDSPCDFSFVSSTYFFGNKSNLEKILKRNE